MALSPTKFNQAVNDLIGVCNFATPDVIKVILCATIPIVTLHYYADLSTYGEPATNYGYTAAGATTGTNSLSGTSGTVSCSCILSSPTWTSNTQDWAALQYFVFYDSTPASNKPLLMFYDYGSAFTLHGANGDTLTLSVAGNTLFTVT